MPSFYSHGKLLITAEYAVLAGAKALAIPCKKGHHLNFQSENKSKELSWNSYDFEGQKWFEVDFHLPSLEIMKSSWMFFEDDFYILKVVIVSQNGIFCCSFCNSWATRTSKSYRSTPCLN